MALDKVYCTPSEVSPEDSAALQKEIAELDPQLFSQVQDAIKLLSSVSKDIAQLPALLYFSVIPDDPNCLSKEEQDKFYAHGLDLIKKGKVAVLLMAGGQGTRLGLSDPKGTYVIGTPSKRLLFELQAARIKRLQDLTGGVIPWYVMTSEPTRAKTESFFQSHDFFGLSKDNVTFFNQGTLPAFTMDGTQLLRDKPGALARLPDGNGGLYRAIQDNGLLADFDKRGVEHVHMYAVDNCLAKVADPLFVGFAALKGFDLATKAVRKTEPKESVGLIVSKDGKPGVIEYSELPDDLAEKKDGNLLYLRAANIVQHYYSVLLLKKSIGSWIASREYLPYHIAKKKIPHLNLQGEYVKPDAPNGIKLEQFIFDIFPAVPLEKFATLEVPRSEEFSPLKNGPGTKSDNPETSSRDLQALHKKWIEANGGVVEGSVEIDGALSYGGELLEWVKGKSFKDGEFIKERV